MVIEQGEARNLEILPTELSDLAKIKPVRRLQSPAQLLRAENEAVTFFWREDELHDLHEWCRLSIGTAGKILAGAGGQGKTRLAIEIGKRLSNEGWSVIYLDTERNLNDTLYATIQSATVPLMLVVDYAETRPAQIDKILNTALDRGPRYKLRVLLIARSAGDWINNLRESRRALLTDSGSFDVLQLAPLADDPVARRASYTQAIRDFAEQLAGIPVFRGVDWDEIVHPDPPAEIVDERFSVILNTHVLALVSLLQAGPTAHLVGRYELPEDILLQHEQDYWQDFATSSNLNLSRGTLKHLVAFATLFPPLAADPQLRRAESDAVLLNLPDLEGQSADVRMRVETWLHDLYPPASGATDRGAGAWSNLQPDRLAEHLAVEVIMQQPQRLEALSPHVSMDQARSAVRVIARAAEHHPEAGALMERLIIGWPKAAVGAVIVAPEFADPQHLTAPLDILLARTNLSSALIQVLASSLPERSLIHQERSVTITRRWVESLRSRPQAGTVEEEIHNAVGLGIALTFFAGRLSVAGRTSEALSASAECLELHRRAQREGVIDKDILARSLAQRAVILAAAGREVEAAELSQEAAKLLEDPSYQVHPSQIELANINRSNAAVFAVPERSQSESLRSAEAAVAVYRNELASGTKEKEYGLAAALIAYSNALSRSGRSAESWQAANESITRLRQLNRANPDEYRSDLALALVTATTKATIEDSSIAEGYALEAIEIYKGLKNLHPGAFRKPLALAFNNYAVLLLMLSRYDDAGRCASEAVAELRVVAGELYDSSLPNALMIVAEVAFKGGDMAKAESSATEASKLLSSSLAPSRADAILAIRTENLRGKIFLNLGRISEASAALERAIQINENNSSVRTDELDALRATSLSFYSIILASLDRPGEALSAALDAVELLRALVRKNPEVHLVEYASANLSLGSSYAAMGDWDRSLLSVEYSCMMMRYLFQTEPSAHGPALGGALLTLGSIHSARREYRDAAAVTVEAISTAHEIGDANSTTAAAQFLRELADIDLPGVQQVWTECTRSPLPGWLAS